MAEGTVLFRFDTRQGYRDAIQGLIAGARHEILMLEKDFSEADLGCKTTYDLLWDFFTRVPAGHLRLLAFDDDYLGQRCARFMQLRARFGHLMTLRCIEGAADWRQGFMLADENHYVLRHHFDWLRGERGVDGLIHAGLQQKFTELWEHGHPPAEWHALNL